MQVIVCFDRVIVCFGRVIVCFDKVIDQYLVHTLLSELLVSNKYITRLDARVIEDPTNI